MSSVKSDGVIDDESGESAEEEHLTDRCRNR